MATIPGFTAITGANVTTSDKTYIADVSAADPQDRSITMAELVTFLGANGLILTSTKDQANGVPGLNDSGDLVRNIQLINHASAAAAGVRPVGTLICIDGELYMSDNATAGGNRVTGAAPSYHNVNATGSITIDPYASHTFINSVMVNDAITITIANLSDIPNGHVIYLYVENTGSANQITINGGVLDTFVIGDALSVLILAKRSTGWTIIQSTSV